MATQQGLTLGTRPGGGTARGTWLLRLLLVGVAAYLVSPVLFSQHLEGYTANLRSIALVWDQGRLADFDTITPIIIQYLFATRSGIILLLEFVDRVFGHPGDAGFRGLVIASFLLLAASSVLVAARWGRLGVAACVIGFIAMPGLVDVGSFFNDNIISAALGMAALATVSRSGSVWSCAASGVLLGAAALCRTDALVLGPAIAGMVWLRHGRLAPLLVRGLAAAAGFLLVSVLAYGITGTTLIGALHIPVQFVPPRIGIAFRFTVFRLFIGVPALVLLCIGAVLNLRRHLAPTDWRWILLFLVYPALILGIAVLRLSTEVRYIYPLLAPFYLVHVGRGLEALATLVRGRGWPRRLGIAAAGALALVCVIPPDTFVRDGPHATVGRLWMPLLWFRWQASVAHSLQKMDELAARADTEPQLLVLSTHFNDEYFFRLRLLEHGFEARPAEREVPGCRGGFSVYAKPGHRTLHLRTENQYGFASSVANVIVRSVQIERALQCPAAWDFDAAYLAFAGEDVRVNTLPLDPMLFHSVLPRLPPIASLSTTFELPAILFPDAPLPEAPSGVSRGEGRMGDIHVIPLTRPELESIKASADRLMADFEADGEPRPFTYEDFKALYRARP